MRDAGELPRISPRLGELTRTNSEAIVGAKAHRVDPARDFTQGVAITSSIHPDDATKKGITDGAYWLRRPGENCEVVIAYTGAVAPEAIEAIGLIGESRRDVGLLAITSADRLHSGWTAARKLRRDRRGVPHLSHIEKLLAPLPRDCGIVTVIDGHPATLGWLGSVRGHKVEALGVEHFGQTGTIDDLYRHHGIDAVEFPPLPARDADAVIEADSVALQNAISQTVMAFCWMCSSLAAREAT